MEQPDKILKKHKLRITNVRRNVLEIFQASKIALNQNDIESALDNPDRITVYRTLNKFESAGLIHKIKDDSTQIKYAYCSDSCDVHDHQDEHIHFQCKKCGNTQCLEEVIPTFKVPDNFVLEETNILIKGICADCN